MGTPTRFPFGLATAKKAQLMGDFPTPHPLTTHVYFDDFISFTAADWTITRTGTTPTEALSDGSGFGNVLLTTVASAASATHLQRVGSTFLPVSGKKMWFATRLQVSDASDTAFAVGLQVTDTTPLDVTDGIYFLKAAGAATFDLICRKDATTGSVSKAAVGSIVAATDIELGWYYDGRQTINVFVNNKNVGDLALTSTPTAYLPDTNLRVSFGIQNGASTVRTARYDYLFAAIER